jgi:hypothetical protein
MAIAIQYPESNLSGFQMYPEFECPIFRSLLYSNFCSALWTKILVSIISHKPHKFKLRTYYILYIEESKEQKKGTVKMLRYKII